MHQPSYSPVQEPGAIAPSPIHPLPPVPQATPAHPQSSHQEPNQASSQESSQASSQAQGYGQLQQQMAQQWGSLTDSVKAHSPLLDEVSGRSLKSWYNCRESARNTRQQAFAALDAATRLEAEIAQLDHSIQQQLQQFDQQLTISAQTLRQEVAQKVGQFHRHIQQQSSRCRDRLKLEAENPPRWTESQREQAQQLFKKTTLRPVSQPDA